VFCEKNNIFSGDFGSFGALGSVIFFPHLAAKIGCLNRIIVEK